MKNSKSNILLKNVRLFKAQKIDFKTFIFSVDKKYVNCILKGISAPKQAKNPYLKTNGFNKYRFLLFECGKEIKNIIEPEIKFE